MKKYDKLVRDKIPAIITNNGGLAIWHQADDQEYYGKLAEKLVEEAQEFYQSRNLEELGDVLEVMMAILELKGMSFGELDILRINKKYTRGSFKGRIILDEAG